MGEIKENIDFHINHNTHGIGVVAIATGMLLMSIILDKCSGVDSLKTAWEQQKTEQPILPQ